MSPVAVALEAGRRKLNRLVSFPQVVATPKGTGLDCQIATRRSTASGP
jgi:hypothetical protein